MQNESNLSFLNEINKLAKIAISGKNEFPDILNDFLIEKFGFQSSVLFKVVNTQTLVVYGRSANSKKTYLRGSTFNIDLSSLFDINLSFAVNTDANNELQVSEFVIYECSVLFNINNAQKGFLKLAKESPFEPEEYDQLRSIVDFTSILITMWLNTKGGNVFPAEKSLSQDIYDISQELRTPANTIIGFTTILSEDNLTSSQAEYANTIKKNAQNLLVNINDLVELSKLESGKTPENKTETNIKILISEVVDSFRNRLNNDLVDYSVVVHKNIPDKILIDDQKIRTVLSTLLTVSQSLTLHGQIKLEICSDGANKLTFIISDTGNGISLDNQKIFFDPFTVKKIDELKKSNLTGLSLVIVKKLVQLIGGDISMESGIGQGTKFTLTLSPGEEFSQSEEEPKVETPVQPKQESKEKPAAKKQVKEESTEAKIEKNLSALPKPNATTNKILVIEDDYASSKLLSNYLNKWGYEPIIVNTEEQTLSLINKEVFLAVIMDIALPNANGLELLRKIHSHENTKNTPVIVCSVEAEQQKAYMMGAVEYFQKPINYNYLVEVLTSYKLRKNSNILCVDDDLPTLNLVKQAIETAGFNAVDENVSANVMENIKDKDIDLAIVDLDMPHPNGFELIKIIKSDPKFAKLPIIIYTGKDNFQDDLMKIEGLFDELLDKRSVNIEDLADTINSMVNRMETPPTVEEVIEKKDVIKILFAEDYKHSQIIVTRLLKKNNFENVAIVDNGKEAYDLAQKEHFDLILMDMQMPIMNGFEATENIRKLPNYKSTPIIALTAFAMKGDREKCLDAGATDYIPKPIDSKEFIEKVKYYTTK
ncbi:MAG: response regulator [Rhodothermaceae bacterium]